MTSSDVRALLRARYAPPEWALLEEVKNATGYSSSEDRSADAIAMNLWPSRGLELIGFEIKVSRSDWLSELKNPAKSAVIQKYCDKWYVVAGKKDIVKSEEIPPTWGLIVLHGEKRLGTVKEAPQLVAQPLDKGFIAAMLRRATELVASVEVTSASYAKGRVDGIAFRENLANIEKRSIERELENLKASLQAFREASGVDIDAWNGRHIGDAVRYAMAQNNAHVSPRAALARAKLPLETALLALNTLDQAAALMESV